MSSVINRCQSDILDNNYIKAQIHFESIIEKKTNDNSENFLTILFLFKKINEISIFKNEPRSSWFVEVNANVIVQKIK